MTPKKPKPTRAVGYVRISVDRDEETSTTTQEERIRAHCKSKGLTVVDVVVEAGRSAYGAQRNNRPGLIRAKGLIASGAADVLVVWKLDRAARNTIDTLQLVEELEGYGAQFVSVTEGFDTSTATGEMMVTMLAGLARMESRTKSERTVAWQEHRRANGAVPTGPRSFGYERPEDEKNKLLIVTDEAEAIQSAAQRVIAGEPLRSIAADLAADGVQGTTGSPMRPRTLRQILLNPVIAACREIKGDFVRSDAWEPILDFKTWQAVRAILKDPDRRKGPGNKRRWLLSGIATCGRGCVDDRKLPVKLSVKYGGTKSPRYFCAKCHLSIEQARTDELVEAGLFKLLDRRAWKRLRQGRPANTVDTTAFKEAMDDLTARFIGGDLDADELAAGAEALRRQQEAISSMPVVLPDVDDLEASWPNLTLDQQRLVLMRVTESLVVMPWTQTSGYDMRRVQWTPVA